MPQWRCLNSRCWETQRPGYDFTADAGVCPKCGASANEPQTARFLIRLAIIHYDPPHPTIAGLGMGYALCDKGRHVSTLHLAQLKRGGVLEQATADANAVNCPQCLAHKDFPGDDFEPKQAVPGWMLGKELQKKNDDKPPCGGCT